MAETATQNTETFERFSSDGKKKKGKKDGLQKGHLIAGLIALLLVILLGNSMIVTRQNQFKLVRQFGRVQRVITQPGQFPPATNGIVASIAARGAKASCVKAAQAAINGETNVGGATHFGRVGKAAGIVIGSHVFY